MSTYKDTLKKISYYKLYSYRKNKNQKKNNNKHSFENPQFVHFFLIKRIYIKLMKLFLLIKLNKKLYCRHAR